MKFLRDCFPLGRFCYWEVKGKLFDERVFSIYSHFRCIEKICKWHWQDLSYKWLNISTKIKHWENFTLQFNSIQFNSIILINICVCMFSITSSNFCVNVDHLCTELFIQSIHRPSPTSSRNVTDQDNFTFPIFK